MLVTVVIFDYTLPARYQDWGAQYQLLPALADTKRKTRTIRKVTSTRPDGTCVP